jgi:hypothetical protein
VYGGINNMALEGGMLTFQRRHYAPPSYFLFARLCFIFNF